VDGSTGIEEPARWKDSAVGGSPDLRHLASGSADLKRLVSSDVSEAVAT
jgi:hypothetical protein